MTGLAGEVWAARWAFDKDDDRRALVEELARKVDFMERRYGEALSALRMSCGDGIDGGVHYECRCNGCEMGREVTKLARK